MRESSRIMPLKVQANTLQKHMNGKARGRRAISKVVENRLVTVRRKKWGRTIKKKNLWLLSQSM